MYPLGTIVYDRLPLKNIEIVSVSCVDYTKWSITPSNTHIFLFSGQKDNKMHARLEEGKNRLLSANDRKFFRDIVVEKSKIIDPDNLSRRLEVMKILYRMEKHGPRWGPTRDELLGIVPFLPVMEGDSVFTGDEFTGTKMEIVEQFVKILQVEYSREGGEQSTENSSEEGAEVSSSKITTPQVPLDKETQELQDRLNSLRSVSPQLPEGWSDDEKNTTFVFSSIMHAKKTGVFTGSDKDYLHGLIWEQSKFIEESNPEVIKMICDSVAPILHIVRDKPDRLPLGLSVSVISKIYLSTIAREISSCQNRVHTPWKNFPVDVTGGNSSSGFGSRKVHKKSKMSFDFSSSEDSSSTSYSSLSDDFGTRKSRKKKRKKKKKKKRYKKVRFAKSSSTLGKNSMVFLPPDSSSSSSSEEITSNAAKLMRWPDPLELSRAKKFKEAHREVKRLSTRYKSSSLNYISDCCYNGNLIADLTNGP